MHRIETDVQVTDILSNPQGKVKCVNFPNELESLRELRIRVLHVACIELWEFRGHGVLTGATRNHRATHPPLMVRCVQDE